jgi:hypothetical protein
MNWLELGCSQKLLLRYVCKRTSFALVLSELYEHTHDTFQIVILDVE